MIKTKQVTTKSPVVLSKMCDVCKKTYSCDEDIYETQEFHHIRFTGGYDSFFGDGTEVECDICQHCLYKMIKEYMRSKDTQFD